MSVARLSSDGINQEPKRARVERPLIMGFSNKDKIGTIQPHDDALVITLRIWGYDMKQVMADRGSTAEIMYPDLYKGLSLRAEDLTPYSSPLVSFNGKVVIPKGQIRLPMQTGSEMVEVDFIVVDTYFPYTAIVARPWLHTLGAVSSTLHQKVKYPSQGQIEEILGDQAMARQCMIAAIRYKPEAELLAHEEKDLQQLKPSMLSIEKLAKEAECEDLVKVTIGDDPEKFFQIKSQLPQHEREELVEFLKQNIDVFAWNTYEASGVDPEFICHHLNVNPSIVPKKQPPRRPSKEHAEAVQEEVTRLKQVRTIKEVFYPEWLANIVVVKKKSGKWRVCIDFTDLNKACPKDSFPMPKIDQLVDATVGHPQMSFLDAFQGYHQITLAVEDQEKTAFVTSIGNYHYKVMSFDLKNAGSTYLRMMTRMFKSLLGKNIEIYIDDIVVKSKVVLEHLGDL